MFWLFCQDCAGWTDKIARFQWEMLEGRNRTWEHASGLWK